MVLGEILRWNAKRHPDKVAIVFDEYRCTFRRLEDRVNRLANGFLQMGLQKGDRVGFMAQNCPQHIELLFAAAKAGIILVPIGFRFVEAEILHIVNDVEPRVLIFTIEHQDQINSIKLQIKNVEKFICLEQKLDFAFYYEDLVQSSSATEPPIVIEENDDLTILYTSGSTGNPKGVIHTQGKWIIGCLNYVCNLMRSENDVALIVAPMYHLASIWPFLLNLFIGGRVVILSRFDPVKVLETVEKEGITNINLVPTHLVDLLEAVKKKQYDISSLRSITYGAAPMPLEVLKQCTETFGHIFTHLYGMTESTSCVTYLKVGGYVETEDQKLSRRLAFSCGQDGINIETRVVNSEGNDVKCGEVGEIIVRGPSITKGYWRLPEETSRKLKNGWFYTGDLATVDEDGYVFITDRKDFKIISGGENIYPKEVEDIIYQHPAVKEVVIVAVPDKRWGEAVKAVVVLKEGFKATEDEIIHFCKERMAGYKKPKSVDFVSDLPKSSLGKILRKEIKKYYWQERTE